MEKKIKEIAKEVYTIGHKLGGCKGCPFENFEDCNFIRCSGSATVESITAQIKKEYAKYKMFIETIENYEFPVLDEIEKEYLTNILKPFVRKEYSIEVKKELSYTIEEAYLCISLIKFGCEEVIEFPYFSKNSMYKNMEADKWYTLDELGLKF